MKKSKKFLALLLGVLVFFNLSGCDVVFLLGYMNKSPLPFIIEEIHVYNESGEEIIGEYVEGYRFEDEKQKSQAMALTKKKVEPLNSAAPVELYYIIDVNEGDKLNLEFKIKINDNKGLTKVELGISDNNWQAENMVEVTNITAEKNDYYTMRYSHVVDSNHYLTAYYWWNKNDTRTHVPARGGEVYNNTVYFNTPNSGNDNQEPVYDIDFIKHNPSITGITADLVSAVSIIEENYSLGPGTLGINYESGDSDAIARLLSEFQVAKVAKSSEGVTPGVGSTIYKFILKDGTFISLSFVGKGYGYEGERYLLKQLPTYSDSESFIKYFTFLIYQESANIISCVDNSIIGEVDLSKFKFVQYSEAEDGPLPDIDLAQYIKTDFGEIIFYTDKIFSVSRSGGYQTQIYKLIGDLTYNDLLVEN